MSIIEIKNVTKSYAERTVLRNISLEVCAGHRIGIVGPNGAGKSTLLRIIVGQIQPDEGYARAYGRIGYLPQEPNWPSKVTVRQQLASINSKALTKFMADWHLNAALLNTPCGFLSGGEKTKLALVQSMAKDPAVLLLDEPTNHLDMKAIEYLEDALKGFNGTLIVVSHDRFFLDNIVNYIWEIHDGNIKAYNGNYSSYVRQKEMEQQRAWQEYEAYIKERNRLEASTRERMAQAQSMAKPKRKNDSFWKEQKDKYAGISSKAAKTAKAIQSRIEHLEVKQKPRQQRSINIAFNQAENHSNIVAQGNSLTKTFGAKILFKDASFTIFSGNRIALLGDNGTGKTTLLKIIVGQQQPDSGQIYISPSVRIGYLDQEVNRLDYNKSILDEVRDSSNADLSTVRNLLGCLLFSGDDVFKPIRALSTGERVRVALAKMLLGRYTMLIMDEPNNFLDIPSRESIEKALADYEGTLLMVSHDRYFISKIADLIWEIDHQQLICYADDYSYYVQKRRNAAKPQNDIKDEILRLEVLLSQLSGRLSQPLPEQEKEQLNQQFMDTARKLNNLRQML